MVIMVLKHHENMKVVSHTLNSDMFTIRIKNITIPMYLGIYEWEKIHLRNVIISLTLKYKKKHIQNTICYDAICQYLEKYHYKNFDLIENLIDTIGNDLLKNTPTIDKLQVKIKKGVILRGQPENLSISKKFQKITG